MSKKWALLIGIEYLDYSNKQKIDRLPGCHNDLFIIRDLLIKKFNYMGSDLDILTDVSSVYAQPTKSNIVQALYRIIDKAKNGVDHIIIYYSGHGTYQTDKNSDEKDGKDECIVPCDFLTAGMLTDDSISSILQQIPSSVKCTFISDSCNSGTLYDLQFIYKNGTIQPSMDKPQLYNANIITLSGCRDNETSASTYDLERSKKWRGAMTVALENAWNKCGFDSNVENIIINTRQFLKLHNYSQVPQLCTSKYINLKQEKFI